MKMPTGRNGRPIIANVERLHRLMDAAGLAAVVVRGGQNVTYLAGVPFHGTLSRHLDLAASRRGVVVIWPRHSPPIFVLEVTAAGAAARDSWIEKFDVFSGYTEALFERVCSVLSELDLTRSPVGFDKNFIGAGFWEDIARRLPAMTMLDCSDLMDDARLIKTEAEIELFRTGATLLDEAFAEVLPTIRAGELEREVHGRMIGSCLARGAEFAHGILNSHRNPVIYCGESDFPFARGDIVRTDYLAYVKGYPGHQSRNAVIGKPSARQTSDYAKYRAIYQAAADRLLPGVAVGELYDIVAQEFAQIGWTYEAGLVGHSVGPWWHQQEPIFCRGGWQVLEPGMVVALEPYMAHWHCQDLFLITEHRAELLSPAFDTQEMFVIEN
jgi:Xaa-Pro aminopeptidase